MTNFYQISQRIFLLSFCSKGSAYWIRLPLSQYMLKTLKSPPEPGKLWVWILEASGTQGLPSLIKYCPKMTFYLFTAKLNICPSCWVITGRMLHDICRYTMAVSLRWTNRGPWASYLTWRASIWGLPDFWQNDAVLFMAVFKTL